MPNLEAAYLTLWHRVHELNAELERGADVRWVRVKLEQALDEALVDYTRWRAARATPSPGNPMQVDRANLAFRRDAHSV